MTGRQEERDAIIGANFCDKEYAGGCRRFEELDYATLDKLVQCGFANIYKAQNDSPTIGEFLEFMQKHPKARAHGYAIAMSRGDHRVSIEGLSMSDGSPEDNTDFVLFCRGADELERSAEIGDDGSVTRYWSWWD